MTLSQTRTRDDYEKFCDDVRKLTKVDLSQYKRAQMERRIRTFVERRGVRSLAAYFEVLNGSAEEVDQFLDRVTINVSQLWRNPEQWDTLGRVLVPELAAAGKIRAWSAGCSYGAEAYTVAATCLATAPSGTRVEVSGTDIDKRMVDRARAGVFSRDDARTAPRAYLERWFEPAGDGWKANSELRRAVRFETGDLLIDRIPTAAYDLVMCRNVVIYFTDEVKNALHARLAASIRSGGYFIVGATERVADPAGMGLVPTQPFTYRKV
ncbi:MAG: protein-glutamate O-methyltransferase CheR [Gaiellales bacterium]